MTAPLLAHFLVPTTKNPEQTLWFIFHHESDGILAFDLTTPHDSIRTNIFAPLIDGTVNLPSEEFVLNGGPNQNDTALIFLDDDPAPREGAINLAGAFSLTSFRLNLVPGKPPALFKSDDAPGHLSPGRARNVLIALGFRVWDMDTLEQELKDWLWTFLPASPNIVFHTPRSEQLTRTRLSIN
jgi:putative AlgH/UPF0301 family transcriptional regulator